MVLVASPECLVIQSVSDYTYISVNIGIHIKHENMNYIFEFDSQ